MKKSASVPVGLLAMVAAMALQAGCGSGSAPTHQRVCGDGKGVRFEDEKCEEESRRSRVGGYMPLYFWYYAPYGKVFPFGTPMRGALPDMPSGRGVRIASPPATKSGTSSTGTVRGGFGSSSGAVGG